MGEAKLMLLGVWKEVLRGEWCPRIPRTVWSIVKTLRGVKIHFHGIRRHSSFYLTRPAARATKSTESPGRRGCLAAPAARHFGTFNTGNCTLRGRIGTRWMAVKERHFCRFPRAASPSKARAFRRWKKAKGAGKDGYRGF